MYSIPTDILIGEQSYHITNDGDYRMVLDCFAALEDPELQKEERIATALIIFYEDLNDLADLGKIDLEIAVKEMFKFFNCGEEHAVGAELNHKVIDWQQDSNLICSAVNNVAKKEVRAEQYLHWWTFFGYYLAIGESPLATVVSIRNKILKGKKLEKYEQEFRRSNPRYFVWNDKTVDQAEADAWARKMWNSGKKEPIEDG